MSRRDTVDNLKEWDAQDKVSEDYVDAKVQIIRRVFSTPAKVNEQAHEGVVGVLNLCMQTLVLV